MKNPLINIQNLKEKIEYAFRVSALNEAGNSDPKEATSLVLVQDTFLPPKLDATQIPHGFTYVKANSTLKIMVSNMSLIQ